MKTESPMSSTDKEEGVKIAAPERQSSSADDTENPPSPASTEQLNRKKPNLDFYVALFFGIPLVGLFVPIINLLLPELGIYLAIFGGFLLLLWFAAIRSFFDQFGW